MRLVGDDLSKVNRIILDRMDSRAPLIPQLAGHIIASGGKRLRPMLTLASALLCGYVGERQIGLAAAVEFILEGLHLSRKLNCDRSGEVATYKR